LGVGTPLKDKVSSKPTNSYDNSTNDGLEYVQETENVYVKKCLKCEEKERVISAQQNTINSLLEQVSDLRNDKQRLLDRLNKYES